MTKSHKDLQARARRSRLIALAAVLLLSGAAAWAFVSLEPISATAVAAQQPAQQPGQPGQAPGARGRGGPPPVPVPPKLQEFNTIDYRIRATPIAELANPYGMAFLPGGDILVTQMNSDIRLIRGGRLVAQPVGRVPGVEVNEAVAIQAASGLMDIAVHPQFTQNRWVYYSYIKPGNMGTMTIGRATFDGTALKDYTDIFASKAVGPVGANIINRIAFAPDGTLYFAVSYHGDDKNSQDLTNHGGKVLRLTDAGMPAPGNPFIGQADKLPEIYTYGHRGIHGLAVNAATGDVWIAEHGDELNLARPGANYGWPYQGIAGQGGGTPTPPIPQGVMVTAPTISWNPAINLSGLTIYAGERFARWKGNFLLGGLGMQQVHRLALPAAVNLAQPIFTQTRETLFTQIGGPVRDIRTGPDGLLYIAVTANPLTATGAIYRIEPIGPPS